MSKIAFFSTYNRDVLDLYMEYCPSEFDVSFGSPTSSLDEMIDITERAEAIILHAMSLPNEVYEVAKNTKLIQLLSAGYDNVNFELIIVDHNSEQAVIDKIKLILSNQLFKNRFVSLNVDDFKKNINPVNEKNEQVTFNQMSNMSNIHQSLLFAKESDDLIYFVEDDYIHSIKTLKEMILTYEKLSTLLKTELILCPTDYPYLYSEIDNSKIFLGDNSHWRSINETLCTFLMSKDMVTKYWDELTSMCKFEHYPFEKPLHNIYQKEHCLSPIPSLAIHLTNINSVFGLSPHIDWKKYWDESEL